MGAWVMNPQMAPAAIKAARKLSTHVRNKVTRRLMKEVSTVQDVTSTAASEWMNGILTRVAQGKC